MNLICTSKSSYRLSAAYGILRYPLWDQGWELCGRFTFQVTFRFCKDFKVASHPGDACPEHLSVRRDWLFQRQMNVAVQQQGSKDTIYEGYGYKTVLISVAEENPKKKKNDL